jgi:hypothetical protein
MHIYQSYKTVSYLNLYARTYVHVPVHADKLFILSCSGFLIGFFLTRSAFKEVRPFFVACYIMLYEDPGFKVTHSRTFGLLISIIFKLKIQYISNSLY